MLGNDQSESGDWAIDRCKKTWRGWLSEHERLVVNEDDLCSPVRLYDR